MDQKMLNHISWMKLKYANNPNQYGILLWVMKDLDLKFRFEALRGLVIQKFESVATAILAAFTVRMASL